VALAQKASRRLLKWYVTPIVEQQHRFSAAVVQALTTHWQENASMEKQFLSREYSARQKTGKHDTDFGLSF